MMCKKDMPVLEKQVNNILEQIAICNVDKNTIMITGQRKTNRTILNQELDYDRFCCQMIRGLSNGSCMKKVCGVLNRNYIRENLNDQNPEISCEFQQDFGEGEGFQWCRMKLIKISCGENGIVREFLLTLENIQRQKEIEIVEQKVLEEVCIAADQAINEKKLFLRKISQDLQNPLNSIVGMVRLAENHISEGQRVNECLKKIKESSFHLFTVINEILDMSRMETIQEKEQSLQIVLDRLKAADVYIDRAGMDEIYFQEKRALVVENQEKYEQKTEKFIQRVGMAVEVAENGEKAVNLFSQSPENYYDIIFIDVHMSEMNGYQVAKNIRKAARQDAAKIPIVAMAKKVFDEDIMLSRSVGINEYISKPVNPENLRTVVEKWLI